MSRYVLSPAARADLEQIWDYTCDRWGDDQAEKYVRELQRAKHAVGTHRLSYRIASADMIDVVRILHQRMDIDRHLD